MNNNTKPETQKRERDDLLNELQVRMEFLAQIKASMQHDIGHYGYFQADWPRYAGESLERLNRVRVELGWERIEL